MAYGLFDFRERNISEKKTIDAVIDLRFSQYRMYICMLNV
jgi:hypothetical protein